MTSFTLDKSKSGLLVIDVQEKLFPKIDRAEDVYLGISKLIQGARIFDLSMVATEQYPEGLGHTIPELRQLLGPCHVLSKTSFSCLGNKEVGRHILEMPVSQWILSGIEAHVCVLQTAKDLLRAGKQVVVVNDAVSSRSIYDFSSAIAELRDCGARISSSETVLFELLGDSQSSEFKQISRLIQSTSCNCRCE